VRPNGRDDEPQFQVDVDRTKAGALGLTLADISRTLTIAWGSAYVDDFVHQGRVKKVYMQADAPFRMQSQDLDTWYLRNSQGKMVPFSVMLVAPLGVLGAMLAALLRGLPSDIHFQVGLLATIGLAAKNAILIVEFAKTSQERGRDAVNATLEAARMRLRPIVMSSLAFGFGVLPLALGSGAGSGGQHAIGTGVIGGVIAGTS
jgi:multidrug efflux pump subunit AcrB